MAMTGWTPVSKARPCAVCLKTRGLCGVSDDGAVACSRYHRDGIACPGDMEPVGDAGKKEGMQVFRPRSGPGSVESFRGGASGSGVVDGKLLEMLRERRARREAEEKKYRERAQRQAVDLWKRAKAGSAGRGGVVAGYIEGRGVGVASLPGGVVPPTLRFLERCPRSRVSPEGKSVPAPETPAVLCVAIDAGKRITGVQRVYLDPGELLGGRAVKLRPLGDGGEDEAKKALGSLNGSAVRLSPVPASGVLVLTEGVETGLAVLAAMTVREDGRGGEERLEAGVWACVAGTFLSTVEFPAEMVAAAGRGGVLRRVIIAGDHDRAQKNGSRPGERYAVEAAAALRGRYPGLEVGVALPDGESVPELSDQGGAPGEKVGGKSVDWLDVYRLVGAGRVRERVLGAACSSEAPGEGSGGGGGDGDGGAGGAGADGGGSGGGGFTSKKYISLTRMGRAQDLLMARFSPGATEAERAGSCFTLAWQDGRYYEWDGNCYKHLPGLVVEAAATAALDGFFKTKRGETAPFAPSPAEVNAALTAAIEYVHVRAKDAPAVLPAAFDMAGRPRWDDRYEPRIIKGTEAEGDRLPAAESCVATDGGVLDLEALVDGKVRMVRSTPRLFTLSSLPFRFDAAALQKAMQEDQEYGISRWVADRCPGWLRLLEQMSGANPEWIDTLQEFLGYCYTSDRSQQKFLLLDGQPGSGKGLVLDGMMNALGKDNVAMTTFGRLAGKFDLSPLVGKLMYQIREFRTGGLTDTAGGLDTLLSITSEDPVPVERKNVDTEPNVDLKGKLVISMNGNLQLRDPSAALVRRMIVLPVSPFDGEPDTRLGARLRAEAEGIFLWGLEGLVRYKRRGRLTECSAGSELRASIQARMSPMKAFVEEECVVYPGADIRCDLLRSVYKKRMEGEGHVHEAKISDSEFGERLRTAVSGVSRRQVMSQGVRKSHYMGVRLREDRDFVQVGAERKFVACREPISQVELPAMYIYQGDLPG